MSSRLGSVAVLALCVAGVVACQSYRPPAYDGQNLFLGYCASCHGPAGAGDGPLAPHLAISRLSDLRELQARNDGVFPRDRLVDIIDGRDFRAIHGSMDMPVWGWQFQREEGITEEGLRNVEARIRALVDHIETLQIDG